ncbi:nucleotide-binding protein [Streptomyces longwoodensis]|uniref:nucleotide-binding protein n=1 Tax=Streptomyces longwoodensis TaxID=68231 RepID=UPI0037F72184
MPSGENWQNDVLRDLRAGAAPQQAASQQPAGQQPPSQHAAAEQHAAAQQPAPDGGAPAPRPPAHPGVPAQNAPGPGRPDPSPQAGPGYGYPQQQPSYGYPQQSAPAYGYPQQPYGEQGAPAASYPQQPYGDQGAAAPGPQQPYGDQGAVPAAPYAQQQPHPGHQAPQPDRHAAPAPQPHAQPQPPARGAGAAPRRGSVPDTRPVLDKRLSAAALKPRRGEPFAARALRAVRRTVSSSAAREVAGATATAEVLQRPVTTGRQIAVTSIRGGSGKTTVAALLGATYAHYRQDPVLIVEADPALGSLPVRLGAESLRWTTGDLAALVEPQMSLLDITGYLVQLPENAWLLPGSQGQVGAMLDTRGYERVMVSLRRYFGVTVVDCETLPAEVARTALSAAQARVLTVPATLEGIASTRSVLEWMRGLPRDITTSTVVVLTETVPHRGLDLDKAAEQLKATGASVLTLPYDRHLAAGGAIRTDLLARATRQAVTRLAADVFELSQKRR